MRFLCCCLCLLVIANAESTLEFVHVFFRHGSRTPELKDTYPNDVYGDKDFTPMGWGQLTNDGKLLSYNLGRLLRKRYGDFLGDIFTPEKVRAASSDFDRTKMSALLVLAGLFPPTLSQQWNAELPWNPIPYNVYKAEYDYVIRRPLAYCPVYAKELERVLNSDIGSKILKENRKIFEYLEENSGKLINTLLDAFQLYQTLTAEAVMNLTLPEWTKKIYPDVVSELAAKQCYLENYNAILKRLNGGRGLQKMIETMKLKMENSLPNRKIHLYSGHENNVINILAALNLFDPHVPKYGAAVILELHYVEEQNARFVKVLYVRDVNEGPADLTIEGCDNLCPFDKFLDITRPHVPINYTAECGSRINLG